LLFIKKPESGLRVREAASRPVNSPVQASLFALLAAILGWHVCYFRLI